MVDKPNWKTGDLLQGLGDPFLRVTFSRFLADGRFRGVIVNPENPLLEGRALDTFVVLSFEKICHT